MKFLDIFLTILHVTVTLFNLCGWIFRSTRRLHLVVISLTAFSWLVLGIKYGIGYCPLTDWQWQIKEKLGERNLPGSFITYCLNKVTGYDFSDSVINIYTGLIFIAVVLFTVYVNLKSQKTRS